MSNLQSLDIKELGIPNVCFSLSREDHPNSEEFQRQRIERGFDDSETWSLTDTIANFIIPRLERYIEIKPEKVVVSDSQLSQYKAILKAMKLIVRNDGEQVYTEHEHQDIDIGLMLFSKYFMSLSW